jgi:hypothetical protein
LFATIFLWAVLAVLFVVTGWVRGRFGGGRD